METGRNLFEAQKYKGMLLHGFAPVHWLNPLLLRRPSSYAQDSVH